MINLARKNTLTVGTVNDQFKMNEMLKPLLSVSGAGVWLGFDRQLLNAFKESQTDKVCRVIDFNDELNSEKFNPLSEIDFEGMYEIQDASEIAKILIETPLTNAYSNKCASTRKAIRLLTVIVLHLHYKNKHIAKENLNGINLIDVVAFIKQPQWMNYHQMLEEMMKFIHDPFGDKAWTSSQTMNTSLTHPFIESVCAGLMDSTDKELDRIVGIILSSVGFYADSEFLPFSTHSTLSVASACRDGFNLFLIADYSSRPSQMMALTLASVFAYKSKKQCDRIKLVIDDMDTFPTTHAIIEQCNHRKDEFYLHGFLSSISKLKQHCKPADFELLMNIFECHLLFKTLDAPTAQWFSDKAGKKVTHHFKLATLFGFGLDVREEVILTKDQIFTLTEDEGVLITAGEVGYQSIGQSIQQQPVYFWQM